MTANLVQVQKILKSSVGREVLMLSITLDSKVDTPKVLEKYAARFGVKPGWLFLTGKHEEIEMLRRKLGIYDPDPIVDADKTQHAGIVTYGNERTGQWAAIPALLKPAHIVKALLRVTLRTSQPIRP